MVNEAQEARVDSHSTDRNGEDRAGDQGTLARLAGKVCVIAGAAGVIGEAAAERLGREGGTVVGIDQIEHSVGALSLRVDLRVEAEVERAFARIHHEFGRIDVLLNNAGLNDPQDHSALDMSEETWDRVLASNLTTTFLSCKHGIPYMLMNDPPSGSVINTGSFLADMGAATSQMAFSAAKAAVIQLSRDLGTHLARRGVRVNALCLGPIETPQLQHLFDSLPSDELPKRLIHYPMGRFGTLQEFAGTVAYLASDDSGFVTGSSFPINGGITTAFTVPS
jgi:NAD(P)-dependent dehydrogenase (short-subunit alcohol dehydrogenase family)